MLPFLLEFALAQLFQTGIDPTGIWVDGLPEFSQEFPRDCHRVEFAHFLMYIIMIFGNIDPMR
jgi:hypothetical protein